MKTSKLVYTNQLPTSMDWAGSLLIYDSVLEKKHRRWIERFPIRHRVKSGEKLKNLTALSADLEKILRKVEPISRERLKVVAFGGGSVGDYAGFIASLIRRGVGFVQVPSTWLAAMDSAHGGKTALNVGSFKNQIGTFYPADTVYLVREVLLSQPKERVREVAGEYYKMKFLTRGSILKRAPTLQNLTPSTLWRDLPKLIKEKIRIVSLDPYELKGPRAWLNLGHTVGHVLEGALGLPHGIAVHYGLAFAIRWSQELGIWRESGQNDARNDVLPSKQELASVLRQVHAPAKWLKRDKKMASAARIRFVFMKKPGYPLTQTMNLQDLTREWKRQSL